MKTITFPALLLLIATSSYCQSDTLITEKISRFTIGIAAGISIPIGNFSKFEQNYIGLSPSNYAGEAKPGFGTDIKFNYGIGKHFGIAGSLYGSVFKGGIADIINSAGTGQTYDHDVEPGKWMIAGFVAGLQYHFSLGKIDMAVQALGGIQKSNSPKVQYKSYFTNPGFPQPVTYETAILQPSITSIDPAVKIGLITTYPFRKSKLFYLQLSYTTSSGNFDGKDMVIKNTNDRYNQVVTYYKPNFVFKCSIRNII